MFDMLRIYNAIGLFIMWILIASLQHGPKEWHSHFSTCHVWAQRTWIFKDIIVTLEISITPPEHRTTCTSRPCHAMHILLARLYITSNQILIFVKAMSSYNDLRNLILQGALRLQTLRVYVSENENLQSKWVLTDIFQDLETNQVRKVRERSKAWLESAKDLWYY